ncbi:MAG: ferrous iron transport protein B [Oligoflexia bacterium]|nr:ferrous iron transport protein B [Oligoflexia bacterium]
MSDGQGQTRTPTPTPTPTPSPSIPPTKKMPVIVLAGQPNCGKSTIFNVVAGLKVNTGNFAGTSITFTETKVQFEGDTFILIDLPGTYSITSSDMAEKVARDYLLAGNVDVVINVIDTSMLARSLEFTLQLIEMQIPMVVAFNMIDEAKRKGISVDIDKFKHLTAISAIPVIGVKGEGVDHLFKSAMTLLRYNKYQPILPVYDREVEDSLHSIIQCYPPELHSHFRVNERFISIRLLEMDEEFIKTVSSISPSWEEIVSKERQSLAQKHNWPEEEVFSSHRHAIVLNLYEKITTHKRTQQKMDLREYLDRIIMNPLGGLLTVFISVLMMFFTAFGLGDLLSKLLDSPFIKLNIIIDGYQRGIIHSALSGLSQGLQAGAGIVLPYLLPLLLLLAIFEDTGLLPRIAFMMDGILHRFGLHGKSILPIILGYGCSVPAIMAVRNLETERDRLLSRLIIPFIACSARTVIILGLVGKYLGPWWTTIVYVGNLAISLIVSLLLSKFNRDISYGIIMDIPPIRYPYPMIALKKVWLRFYEFLKLGWPIVMLSSVALSILSLYGIDEVVNKILSPITVNNRSY